VYETIGKNGGKCKQKVKYMELNLTVRELFVSWQCMCTVASSFSLHTSESIAE